MVRTELQKRVYHDGIINAHDKDEFSVNFPIYTLIRHDPELWDGKIDFTVYTIIAQYIDGTTKDYLFDNAKTAFWCFRKMVGIC